MRVTWANDGHPAADATVTATAVAPDGTQLTPVAAGPADDDGRYAGAVEYPAPGTWTVRITSIDPTGTIEQAEEVTAIRHAPSAATSPPARPRTVGSPRRRTAPEPAPTAGDSADDAAQAGQPTTGGGDDGGCRCCWSWPAAVVLVGAVTAVEHHPPDPRQPARGPDYRGPTRRRPTAGSSPERRPQAPPSDTPTTGRPGAP